MTAPLPCVLCIDDEERILRSLRMLFRGRFEVLATTSGREAMAWVRSRRVHVVVSDQRMPETSGVEVLREVARLSPTTMRILLTGYADLDAVTASVNEGEIYRYVEKPWDAARLVETVQQAAAAAVREFAAADLRGQPGAARPAMAAVAARVLVLDEEADIAAQVREILPAAVQVEHATALEDALERIAGEEFAILVARLSSSGGDVADALKQLKQVRPETLAVVVSPLRDSRLVIGLINEGQIFRFLLQPPPRELLRRGLVAALERHSEMRANGLLRRRHAVEPPRSPPATMPGRLLQVWRRIREATVARSA